MAFVEFDNHIKQLLFPIPMAIVLMVLRFMFEKYIFTRIAIHLGIKMSSAKTIAANPILEQAYHLSKKWNQNQMVKLSLKVNMTERQVERWLRERNRRGKPSKLVKFCENTWKCLYYIFSFTYGIIILWNKPWLWDINKCWIDVSNQQVSTDIWWYYMISLSFYFALFMSQFFDVKRKDFWEMFAHHTLTILLMSLSWIYRFIRIGTLVLLVHDFADIFLEGAKLTHYAKFARARDVLFVLFGISWIVTRLGIYPLWIIRSCFEVKNVSYVAYYTFNSLLILLLILHCFWTFLLAKFVMDSFIPGRMNKDIRSSSESEGGGDHLKSL